MAATTISTQAQGAASMYDVIGLSASLASIIGFGFFIYPRNLFYHAIVVGSVFLVLSCDSIAGSAFGAYLNIWTLVVIPIYLAIIVSLVFLLKSKLTFIYAKFEMGTSCGFVVANALIVFILFARATSYANTLFFINQFVCVAQIAIFLAVYALAQHRGIENSNNATNDRLALLTTIFLAGASYAAYSSGSFNKKLSTATAIELVYYNHYLLVAYGFYVLWAFCAWHCFKNLQRLRF